VTEHLTWEPHENSSFTRSLLKGWIREYKKSGYYSWAITIKESGELIGSLGLNDISDRNKSCEVGYCISKRFWNRGFLSEALGAVIDLCFSTIGFNRLMACHSVRNPASGRVMQKCGMTFEGTMRQALVNQNGEFINCDMYSILKDDME